MHTTIHWIDHPNIKNNQLGIMARPRGNDWLDDEIKYLKIREIDYFVSLLEPSEERELGLQNESISCSKQGIQFINFPIQDVSIPNCEDKFIQLVKILSNQLDQNKKIAIHCRMGIGRAALLSAAILINRGFKGQEAFDTISQSRKLKVPDTLEQEIWILSREIEFQ